MSLAVYQLNERALELCRRIESHASRLRVNVSHDPECGKLFDLGIEARGGLEAGLALAEVCLAGLASVKLAAAPRDVWNGPAVAVFTDHPVAACMASQYAGWQISVGKFFAMGSGPMRAAAGREPLFARIGFTETAERIVGVLETRKRPGAEVFAEIARHCGVEPDRVTLLAAPTASQAGTVQICARSVETALHKLLELSFDAARVESGWGIAPLPPVARDDLDAIGRTNDAVLYGAEVTLWVRGDDASLQAVGPRVPSSASTDHGEPFRRIFERAGRDFYKIDPQLFSPAVITFVNLDTGRSFRFGRTLPDVLQRSFTD